MSSQLENSYIYLSTTESNARISMQGLQWNDEEIDLIYSVVFYVKTCRSRTTSHWKADDMHEFRQKKARRLTCVSLYPSWVARTWVRGMNCSVSSVAYPNMWPWSPAPVSSNVFVPKPWTPWPMSGLCSSKCTRTYRKRIAELEAKTFWPRSLTWLVAMISET